MLYIVASSIDGGRRASAASMLGIQAGALVHVVAAALGLSGVLAASAVAKTALFLALDVTSKQVPGTSGATSKQVPGTSGARHRGRRHQARQPPP